MERTSSKLPSGTFTIEGTSWNLHHGSYLMELRQGIYLVELTLWKLPHGTYTMEVTSWTLHHGSYLIDPAL